MILSIIMMIALEVSESIFAKDLLSDLKKQQGLQSYYKVIPQWISIISLLGTTCATFFRTSNILMKRLLTPLFLLCVHFPIIARFFTQTQYSELHYSLAVIMSFG